VFPVVDSIIKHIIYERHHHQHKEYLDKKKGSQWVDTKAKKKHAITRRNEKRERRMKKIKKLIMLKDPIIRRLRSHEIELIMKDNRYHSPELSETDPDESKKRMVVIQDLLWRSSI
ncbi:11651_t:CDS:2, partial [Ambispora leptoticha]